MAPSFQYLICLDFEATCWKERDNSESEIIEFGAVLLNIRNGTIESEFHEYIRPTLRPVLSEYCINLTGITQELINNQSTFNDVYLMFLEWLAEIERTYQLKFATPSSRSITHEKDTTFCTWTNWVLSHYLRLDCERHEVEQYPPFKVWIDARKIFRKVNPGMYTFEEALKHINITHSDISDSKTLAKMMYKLYMADADLSQATDWRFR